jgi:hypothetical protein
MSTIVSLRECLLVQLCLDLNVCCGVLVVVTSSYVKRQLNNFWRYVYTGTCHIIVYLCYLWIIIAQICSSFSDIKSSMEIDIFIIFVLPEFSLVFVSRISATREKAWVLVACCVYQMRVLFYCRNHILIGFHRNLSSVLLRNECLIIYHLCNSKHRDCICRFVDVCLGYVVLVHIIA